MQNLNVGNQVRKTGGISDDEILADSTINDLVNKVKSQVLGNLTENANTLTPISYKTQTVAGKNYFIKVYIDVEIEFSKNLNTSLKCAHSAYEKQVDIGSGKYVHLRVYLDLSDNVSLAGISEGKTKDDPIDYFEPKNKTKSQK